MPKTTRCPECHRLWGEYLSALFEHASADRQLYFVTLGQEPGSIPALTGALHVAALAKDALRESIRKHQQTHGTAASA